MKKRFRLRFTFWLDVLKPQEVEVADRIDGLKQSRQFSEAIRVGLLLFDDLRQGKIDTLLEHFPWVKDKILAQYATESNIQDHISRLEKLIYQQSTANQMQNHFAPRHTSPQINDVELEVKESKVDTQEITKNLNQSLLSMFN